MYCVSQKRKASVTKESVNKVKYKDEKVHFSTQTDDRVEEGISVVMYLFYQFSNWGNWDFGYYL